MKTLLELQEERTHAIKTSRDILEKAKADDERPLTTEEKTELAGLQKDLARLDGEIQERMLFDKYDQTTAMQVESLASERKTAPTTPINDGDGPKPNVRSYGQRYGSLKAFKGPHAERDAYRTGQFLRGALLGNERAARWCLNDGLDYRALAVGVNTAGGFLVPEEMATAIIDLRETYGVFRRECSVVPMARDLMTIPRRAGGVTATFTPENTALTASDPTFNQVTLTARKLGVITRMSTEIAEDAIINMADWVAKEFAYAFAKMEDDCGFKGTGTAAYGSITGITIKIVDGTHTAGAQDATAGSDQYSDMIAADLGALIGLCPTYALPNAKWYCSNTCWGGGFERLMAAAGGNTTVTLAGTVQRAYLGYPVVISQSLPTTTAAQDGAAMLLFGDLSLAATLGDRREITVALSTDRYFVEDQVAIKATQRFDIAVHDLGDTSDAGPIVAMIGNTS